MSNEIRQQLSQARLARGITFRKLAENLNVSIAHLCDIEKGRKHPSKELADKLKMIFPNVELEKLILMPCADRIAELEAENQRLNALNDDLIGVNQRLEIDNVKLKSANRWIPVSERLPETQGRYQITYKFANGDRQVSDGWFDGIKFNNINYIAWRELPEPYQEGK